jgi:hypothetical protein
MTCCVCNLWRGATVALQFANWTVAMHSSV